jgi:YbgC/YbaW family acyl-CoA thioester hydrolase
MKHMIRMTVRFGEIDGAGIVYYPNFFDYYHRAFEEFFGSCVGIPYDRVLSEERVGFPAVHIESDFKLPLRHGDEIDVEMAIQRIGESSFTSLYRLRRGGNLCATASIVTAVVNLDTMESIPLPQKYRAVLQEYLAA